MKNRRFTGMALAVMVIMPLCLALSAVVVQGTCDCFSIDLPLCSDLFEEQWNACESRCGSETPGGCGSMRGYDVFNIPTAVASESGYWEYASKQLPQLCADIYTCMDSDTPCGILGTNYVCETEEYDTFSITEGQYGVDFTCPNEQ